MSPHSPAQRQRLQGPSAEQGQQVHGGGRVPGESPASQPLDSSPHTPLSAKIRGKENLSN